MPDPATLLDAILALHDRIRAAVVAACTASGPNALARVADDGPGDTIFAIDRVSEGILIEGFNEIAQREPLCLIAEGLAGDKLTLPHGASEDDCKWRVIVDPIDGTRGLMYQKRSAWILTGVAPNRGPATRLRDVALAVQTEIPLVKQHLCDQLWAIRGGGVTARRFNRLSGVHTDLQLTPSRANSIRHGYVTVSRFFPGGRDVLAAIDDEIVRDLAGNIEPGKAACFEDQYASTGGQIYELCAGHDRFTADLRPLLRAVLRERGLELGLCCHPYDICTQLIAEELGVIITDMFGRPLDSPLDVAAEVAWIGYANATLRTQIEPSLQRALARHGLVHAIARSH